jgi:hypothetical protein
MNGHCPATRPNYSKPLSHADTSLVCCRCPFAVAAICVRVVCQIRARRSAAAREPWRGKLRRCPFIWPRQTVVGRFGFLLWLCIVHVSRPGWLFELVKAPSMLDHHASDACVRFASLPMMLLCRSYPSPSAGRGILQASGSISLAVASCRCMEWLLLRNLSPRPRTLWWCAAAHWSRS